MSRIENASIDTYARQSYLAYAMSVVLDRAIPSVEDGLKPVQRRILFAMDELGLLGAGVKAKKCARVVGDVLGKYHPHGDSATYEALVRVAQPFTLRYPIIHGEGNFGSRDGDRAAAYRYTECKLHPIAETLLSELKWDTVDFSPTFDSTGKEPELLPARLPFLLLNGASGIAVGMATECLPHRLAEVGAAAIQALERPDCMLSVEEFMHHVPGPDFATGACIVSSPEEIAKTYSEGRGGVRVRARWRVEREEKGKKWKLVFFEVPQPTAAEKIMIQINGLINPEPKEKKGRKLPLSQEQTRVKKLFTDMIANFEDHSGKEQAVRLVITPRDKDMDPDVLARTLCAHTDLEINVPANFVAVDRAGSPRQAPIMEWLAQWCLFRVDTVRRRLNDEQRRVLHRLHILAGRLSILDRIKEVITVIAESDEPKKDLMEKFGLDDIQADDVLDVRLRQLARLEKTKLLDEQKKLQAEAKRLAALLAKEKALRVQVVKELEADIALYGVNDDRRSELRPDGKVEVRKLMQDSAVSERLAPEPVAVVLTERGWLAWRPAKSLEDAADQDFKIKAGDVVRRMWFGDRSHHLVLMDQKGRGYSLSLSDLSKADAAPVTTWWDPEAPLVEGSIAGPDDRFLLCGQQGYGFVIHRNDWVSRMKAGKAMLKLEEGELPLPPLPLTGVTEATRVATLTDDGRTVVFPLSDVKQMPKGLGVGLMGVAAAKLTGVARVEPGDPLWIKRSTGKVQKITAEAWGGVDGARASGKKGKKLVEGAVAFAADPASLAAPAEQG
jgi:topoisomerase-4 subunit A